ncbi:MAG: hypothetical protein M3Q27_17005 [Actinomycetota bacterium]|nr:hypothetical protein [Actinomycetota bacterium]
MTTTSSTRRAATAAAAVLTTLSLVLTGCGGDDGADVREGGTTSQSGSGSASE